MKRLLIIVAAFFCRSSYAQEAPAGASGQPKQPSADLCLIKNESSWSILISAQDLGFDLVLRPHDAYVVNSSEDLTFLPYGKVWGEVIGPVLTEKKVCSYEQRKNMAQRRGGAPFIRIVTYTPEEISAQQSTGWYETFKQSITAAFEATKRVVGIAHYDLALDTAMFLPKQLKKFSQQPHLLELLPLHALLSTGTDPRYFLKLKKDFKKEEIDKAKNSLVLDNFSTLPDGILKIELQKLALKAAALLHAVIDAPQTSQDELREKNTQEWMQELAKTRKILGKEVVCRVLHAEERKPLLDVLYEFDPAVLSTDESIRNSAVKEFITDFMWHLYTLAEEKQQEFSEGTFVLVGMAAERAQMLLMEYIKLVNPLEFGPLSPTSPVAYPRVSSHFDHNFTHYGIDVGLVLPEQKQHILFGEVEPVLRERFDRSALKELGGQFIAFGKIEEGEEKEYEKPDMPVSRFFIKFENFGLNFKDILGHGVEYIMSLQTKTAAKYSGKSADDDPHYRKERIPAEFKTRFAELLKKSALPEEQQHKHKKQFNELGLQYLYMFVHMSKGLSLDDKNAFKAMLDPIQSETKNSHTVYDHINLRFGREVIILTEDICPLKPHIVPVTGASIMRAPVLTPELSQRVTEFVSQRVSRSMEKTPATSPSETPSVSSQEEWDIIETGT